MVVVEDVRAWVNDGKYVSLLDSVAKRLQLKVNSESVPDVVLQFDANKLNLAELSLADLACIAQNPDLVCRFVAEKLNALKDAADEQEGKSPEDEDDVVVETHAYYRNFLNLYLIELHFLSVNPAALEGYLKSIRVPGAKKYSAQLGRIYKAISS